jgi:hypothetical protein
MPQKPEDRDYDAEYARFAGKPAEIKKRGLRVMARRKMEKANGKKKIPKGMDVDHKIALKNGGTNAAGNLRLVSAKKNRGYKRDKNNKPI